MNCFDLDFPLLNWGDKDGRMDWATSNAVEGVQIFDCIGSGKTSGSGRTLALKYLSVGFGGLVLTVKPYLYRRNRRLHRSGGVQQAKNSSERNSPKKQAYVHVQSTLTNSKRNYL